MQIHNVEQGTEEWLKLRSGIATASEFSKMVSPTGKPSTQINGYADLLAAETLVGGPIDPFTGNAATERGHDLEPEAREFYEFTTGLKVKTVGFITNDAGTAGASPDSLVGSDGMLEIKCPLAPKFMACLPFIREEKCPPDYFIQVQAQLLIAEREWCDLFVYHPQLPSHPVRVYPDEKYQAVMREQLDKLQVLKAASLALLHKEQEAA